MNPMNDERFFDLAMKVIACQCTDAERAELDALLVREPERGAEFARLEADARVAKEALPLVDATQATAGELPAYARGRLQMKVRQTLGRPKTSDEPNRARERSAMWAWQRVLGLVAATAVVVLVALPMFRVSSEPVIQLAMLDTAGTVRGADSNEATLLRQSWDKATVNSFSNADELQAWQTNWPTAGKQPIVKIICDRAAGEVKVLGRWDGKTIEKTFLIEPDLATALKQAKEFIGSETKR